MSILDQLTQAVERATHVKPAQLKGFPGLKAGQEDIAAVVLNVLLTSAIQTTLVQAPHVAENALHIKPTQLKGLPFVHDPAAAAAAFNALVHSQLGGS